MVKHSIPSPLDFQPVCHYGWMEEGLSIGLFLRQTNYSHPRGLTRVIAHTCLHLLMLTTYWSEMMEKEGLLLRTEEGRTRLYRNDNIRFSFSVFRFRLSLLSYVQSAFRVFFYCGSDNLRSRKVRSDAKVQKYWVFSTLTSI